MPEALKEPFRVHADQQGTHPSKNAKDEEIIAFAKLAIAEYKAIFGTKAACSPILRVDIFKTQDGRLVVNEFESLEAHILPVGYRGGDRMGLICTYLKAYWKGVIKACVEKVVRNKT